MEFNLEFFQMSRLNYLGMNYHTDKAFDHKFCDFYESNLDKTAKIVWEIGVLNGASLNMWANYYQTSEVIGFDIEDKSQLRLLPNCKTEILDQGNLDMLKKLGERKGVDLIVDDGSHIIDHQILTFETLFSSLREKGKYIIEDLHTSTNVWHGYNYRDRKGTLEYLYDLMHGDIPVGYPAQYRTAEIAKEIESIVILSNFRKDGTRSITSIITRK
jgi:hypothetical protein